MMVKQAAAAGVHAGKSTSQIIAENPHLNSNSISVIASRIRKEMGLSGKTVSGRPVQLTRHLHDAIEVEALARGAKSANVLSLRLLQIIVKDDLFNAILGEAK